MFRKAERKQSYLKIALTGPSGSGKTYSALLMSSGMGKKIAMLDTENGSGELYSDICNYDIETITPPFTHTKYIEVIKEAQNAGYDVLIIDSLTHVWSGSGGLLEQQEQIARTKYKGNTWAAWKDITPMHDALVQAILQSKIHIIATMRSKQDYIQTEDKKIKKVGMAPQQREGMDYEFTIVFDIDREKHEATASKDRTKLFDNVIEVITADTGRRIMEWSRNGTLEDNYVKISADNVLVKTRTGMTDIKELSAEQLNKLLDSSLYKLAHEAIKLQLDQLVDSADLPNDNVPSEKIDVANLELSDDMFKDDAIDK